MTGRRRHGGHGGRLFAPDPVRIAPAKTAPTPDCVAEPFARGSEPALRRDLEGLLGADNVFSSVSDLVRYATDASPYRLIPAIVVAPQNAEGVASVLSYARRTQRALTFRAGGTSLNGQAQGDGILVDVRRHFQGGTVLEEGARIRLRPGTTLAQANAMLAPYRARLGPDPASSIAATVGGVVANNASGMSCGVQHDSYHTLDSAVLVLASGTVVDTGAPDADAELARAEPRLAAGLMELKGRIEQNGELVARLRKKHLLKNTNGYRLDAFLDGNSPVSILQRLIVGSEGTLAFVAEATFRTLPIRPLHATALLLFSSLEAAADCVPALADAGAVALELMDATTIRRARLSSPDGSLPAAPVDAHGLLVELEAADTGALEGLERTIAAILSGLDLACPATLTRDRVLAASLWQVRSGILVTTGSTRPSGTSLIIEDVCVPPGRLAEAVGAIEDLLDRHRFAGAGVFGHASAGNLHFLLTPAFGDESERERYGAFMEELVDLVVGRFDGSLKAEHGTGRAMAPFLSAEWGTDATELMWATKRLLDPDAVLGPGVVLNRDPAAHLERLHSSPEVEALVDGCIECGYCEPTCPSRLLTTTPRQRIALRREMQRQPVGSEVLGELVAAYEYDAIETCAGDGSCALACPVGIDTGALMKRYRHLEHTDRSERVALGIARGWRGAEATARAVIRGGHVARRWVGPRCFDTLVGVLRGSVSNELLPAWIDAMPRAQTARLPSTRRSDAAALYFPACVNRIFGVAVGGERRTNVIEALVNLSRRAGRPLWVPEDVAGLCCATVWQSKGYEQARDYMANRVTERLFEWSDGGRLPVVTDASSCALGLRRDIAPALSDENAARHRRLTIVDSVAWVHDALLDQLTIPRRVRRVVVHPTCAVRHLGEVDRLMAIAHHIAMEVVVPPEAGCCGFAGDRGMLHPELPQTANAALAARLASETADAYLSSNRPCEIGLRGATGAPYQSYVLLLDALSAEAPWRASAPRGAESDSSGMGAEMW